MPSGLVATRAIPRKLDPVALDEEGLCLAPRLLTALLVGPGEDLGLAGQEVDLLSGGEELRATAGQTPGIEVARHVVRPGPQQAQDQGQGVRGGLERDHLVPGDVVPFPRAVVGEQLRDDGPVGAQELLDLLGCDRVGRTQGIERGGVGDPRPR